MGTTVGGLPRQFWYLWANTLINRIGSFAVIVLAFYLTQQRHLSPTYAGFVLGLWGAGGAIGTLVGGVLADRWGRKPTFLTALYSSAAMMLALGFARGKVEIAIVVLMLGITSDAARPAMAALMLDIVPAADRLRAFSLNYWVINLGFAFAATIAGLVADVDYLLLFVLDAATTTAAATLIAVTITEPPRAPIALRRKPAGEESAEEARSTVAANGGRLTDVFADRVFMGFVGINVLTSLVFLQHISTLPIAMGQDGLSASAFGQIIALNGLLIVAGQLFVPRLLRGRSHASALAAAALVMGIGFGLNAFAHTAWFYAIAVVVWTVGEMLNSPSNSTTIAELSRSDMRGRYQGVFSFSWTIAGFAAPLLGALVLQHWGAATLWLGCLALSIIIAGLHVVSGPARDRRARELHTLGDATQAGEPVEVSSSAPAPVVVRAESAR